VPASLSGLTFDQGRGLPLGREASLPCYGLRRRGRPRNVMHDAGEPGRPLLPAELFRQRTVHPDAAKRNSQGDDGLRSDDGDQDHRADIFSPLRKISFFTGPQRNKA
jgi:hypothetical protein